MIDMLCLSGARYARAYSRGVRVPGDRSLPEVIGLEPSPDVHVCDGVAWVIKRGTRADNVLCIINPPDRRLAAVGQRQERALNGHRHGTGD